jgi:putative NADH-flavin reductase
VNVVVFGATGGTGHHFVDLALADGHRVTASVRPSSTLAMAHDRLRLLSGDVRDPDHIAAAIAGQDAVVSALGPNQRGPASLCAAAIARILPAMADHGVRRLVALSAYGAAESHERNLYNRLLWIMQREKMLDKERMETLIKKSDLDWTILRPSALTNGPQTGRYRLGNDLGMRVTSKISRADLADALLRQLTDLAYAGQAPTITA